MIPNTGSAQKRTKETWPCPAGLKETDTPWLGGPERQSSGGLGGCSLVLGDVRGYVPILWGLD